MHTLFFSDNVPVWNSPPADVIRSLTSPTGKAGRGGASS